MASDKKLLAKVRAAANSIRAASAWKKSKYAVNISDDFLYEMYVLGEILLDLRKKYVVDYDQGKGKKKDLFPRSPAHKAGRPKFLVRDRASGDLLWQVCAGTKVEDKEGNEHGLDISLQTNDSPESNPGYAHALVAWECKFKEDPTTRVSKDEYERFAGWVRRLDLVPSKCPTTLLPGLSALNGNTVVTNGKESTYTDSSRGNDSVCEVSGFYPGKSHKAYP